MSDKILPSESGKSEKKNRVFLPKLVLSFVVIILAYVGFQFWQNHSNKERAKSELEKFSNSDSDIFDLSKSEENQESQYDIADLTINEMRERGAEFVYKILLKNQVQLDALKTDILLLKSEILKYKNQEKIGKMIFTYVGLREKIFAGLKYDNELKNFDILTANNSDLQNKVEALEKLLPTFITNEELIADFKQLIPELIVTKKYGEESGVMSKIRRNVSKLVVIRRIDEKGNSDIDIALVKIEKFLQKNDCAEVSKITNSLEEKYKIILKKFLGDLAVSCELQKTDQEILNFLKNLT